ncbi:MAG: hypothetical protein K2M44_00975, partial [Clostridia bacterium]|nr:hypothetical protein [Clostridia bacterium]
DGTTSTDDIELTLTIAKAQLPSEWTSSGSLPTIDIPEELAGCLNNNAFTYTYTDEDGNTVSASEMVAGKKYNVKATLKEEYAGNFEFVDASGNVLPDATVSTSHEFDYTGGIGDGSMIGREELEKILDGYFSRYNNLMFVLIIIMSVMTAIIFGIILVVGAILRRIKERDKRDADNNDKDRINKKTSQEE